MIVLCSVILAAGIVMAIIGMRGRIVGDDPYCRACGFNLRGRDQTSGPRCSECGAELTDEAKAVRIGLRQRRWRWLGPGSGIALLAAIALGVVGTRFFLDYNFAPWKTTAWLFSDLDSPNARDKARASDELKKRIQTPTFAQTKVDWLMDQTIARQCDFKKQSNPLLPGLIDAAARIDRIDDARLKEFVRRGVMLKLQLKPKLRVDQQAKMMFEFMPYRVGQHSYALSGSPLLMDEVVFRKQWLNHQNLNGGLTATTIQGGMYGEREGKLVPGKHKVHADVDIKAMFGRKTIDVSIPVSTDVEVFPADTPIDAFTVNPAQRAAMRSGFEAVRILKGESPSVREVRVKAGSLPVGAAMELVLSRDGKEYPAGTLLIDANSPVHWYRVFYSSYLAKVTGTVDLRLRPTQAAADPTLVVGNYWGEEIVIPNVTIDAPYDPPFLHDPSLQAPMEKAISAKLTRRPGGKLEVTVMAKPTPAKLSHLLFLRWNGREFPLRDYNFITTMSNRGGGYGQEMVEPDRMAQAKSYDVILRPDPQWEAHAYADAIPPWDGEIVLHDVPVK